MEKNYCEKRIVLDEPATTIPVMEWIRDNGCPHLSYTIFADKFGNGLMVSSQCEEDMSAYLECFEAGDYEWFEYKGMKRHYLCGWTFCIDGKYYFATKY
jgi:hypothetical protein